MKYRFAIKLNDWNNWWFFRIMCGYYWCGKLIVIILFLKQHKITHFPLKIKIGIKLTVLSEGSSLQVQYGKHYMQSNQWLRRLYDCTEWCSLRECFIWMISNSLWNFSIVVLHTRNPFYVFSAVRHRSLCLKTDKITIINNG